MVDKLLAFQEDIYATNVSKGFWTEDRNKGEAVALICSELYEAVEAHRKDNHCTYLRFDALRNSLYGIEDDNSEGARNWYQQQFKVYVKDTVEDEIADAVIRILDCCRGWDWSLVPQEMYNKESTGNFAHDILRINWYIINAFHRKVGQNIGLNRGHMDWGYVMESIIALCSWYQINLVQHVEWKLRYNKSRPFKHNKQY